MVYHASLLVMPYCSGLNVFHYVTVRALLGLMGSLVTFFLLAPLFLSFSRRFFRAKSREYTPENHRAKDNVPTMGGILIVAVVILNMLLWTNLSCSQVWIVLLTLILFGALGLWDDWSKVFYKRGISAGVKSSCQVGVAALIAWLLLYCGISTTITIPFFKNVLLDIGPFFALWVIFILVAMSNAVNLTDGLDGLATGSLIPNFATFSIIAYLAGHYGMADYLHIPFAATAEIAVVGAILIGACMGFLWYNTYPAEIFMGDVGSLALGGVLGLMAIMAKQELLLVLSGGLFVVETLSVMFQVLSFRYRGKRIFRMAPIHHHFELVGWPETKITVRFGIITTILSLLALVTLKIR